MVVTHRRVGILGGSFDPVHNGHLAMAREARHRLQLDRIWLMPAYQSPRKAVRAVAGPEDRRAMVDLAIQEEPGLTLCDLELQRGGPSFTVETLEQLHQDKPENTWFWILGLDAFLDFPSWKQPQRILELANLVVVMRPGCDWAGAEAVIARWGREQPPPYEISGTDSGLRDYSKPGLGPQLYFLDMPPQDIASSHIRQGFGGDPAIKKMLPPAVVQYIMRHNLYV